MTFDDLRLQIYETKIPKLVLLELQRAAIEAEGLAKGNATTVLKVRSGNLRRSIQGEANQTTDGAELVLRAGGGPRDVRYAAAHEKGAVIRPKNGGLLWIPTALSRTPSGVNRYSGPGADPRPMAYVQSRRGQPLLVSAKRTKGGKAAKGYGLDVLYIGRKRVIIPKRPYLQPALDQTVQALGPRLALRLKTALLTGRP